MVKEAIERLNERLARQPELLARARAKGRKVIGYFCPYVPEELILAAGMQPLRLTFGGELEPSAAGEEFLKPYSCPSCRSCLGYAMDGDNLYYGMVDAFCIAQTCEGIRHAQEYLENHFARPVFRVGLSHTADSCRSHPQALDYYRGELEVLRQRLGEFAGREISHRSIRREISLCNQAREILRSFFEYSREERSPMSWYDAFRIVQAGFQMDRREYLAEIRDIAARLPVNRKDWARQEGIRLMIMGSIIGSGDSKVLELIQDCGGNIVVDAVCTGASFVRKDVNYSGLLADPIDALAERYLYNVPCPCNIDAERRRKRAATLVRDYHVAGVIYYSLKFCDTWRSEFLSIKGHLLSETGVPSLLIESNYSPSDMGITRTKIEAFLEMVGGI